jgi:hypothetical protein
MRAFATLTCCVATLMLAGAAHAQATKHANQCFLMSQMQDWRAPDARTIYIRVNVRDYYRLDLSGECPELTAPDAHLITKTRGSDWVCSAIDWDLRVGEGGPPGGFVTPCIVQSMTKMTPAQVAAIPPKSRP